MAATRRRWGYIVWGVAAVLIGGPEITAAVYTDSPFTTISTLTGHLEYRWSSLEVLVVAVIVGVAYSLVRNPPRPGARGPHRTPGGRLTVRTTTAPAAPTFDDGEVSLWFGIAAAGSLAIAGVATFAVVNWTDDPRHFRASATAYGILGVLWLVGPSAVALFWEKDPPFPTLFRTVHNLEQWLRSRRWPRRLGPLSAAVVGFIVLAGMVVLLLHLTFYPYPHITHAINPADGLNNP